MKVIKDFIKTYFGSCGWLDLIPCWSIQRAKRCLQSKPSVYINKTEVKMKVNQKTGTFCATKIGLY